MKFRNLNCAYSKYASTFLVFILTLGSVSAQDKKVRLSGTTLTATEILEQISDQTGYRFAYDKELFDPLQVIRLTESDTEVKNILHEMFRSEPVEYTVRGNLIVFAPGRSKPDINYQPEEKTAMQTVPEPENDTAASFHAPVIDNLQFEKYELVKPNGDLLTLSNYVPVSFYGEVAMSNPRFALKSNLLYAGATLTPNLAFEIAVGKQSTIDIKGSYNWQGRTSAASLHHKQRVHMLLSPEYRWWLCERYNSHFFGAHLLYTRYNVSGIKVPLLYDKTDRYDGHGFGAGVSYGYHLPLAKRWGLEFNVGVGYIYMDYDKFSCAKCDAQAIPATKHYFGPTRAGVSLVFMIK